MSKTKTVLAGLTVGVLIIALIIGLWFLIWFVREQNVERRYEVNTGTQQYQSGLISQQRDRVAAYDATSNEAQKANIASTFCAVQQEVTTLPADLAEAESRICN